MLIDLCGQHGVIKLTNKVIEFDQVGHTTIIILREFLTMSFAKLQTVFIGTTLKVQIKLAIFIYEYLDIVNNGI
jgi:hypothetical protein